MWREPRGKYLVVPGFLPTSHLSTTLQFPNSSMLHVDHGHPFVRGVQVGPWKSRRRGDAFRPITTHASLSLVMPLFPDPRFRASTIRTDIVSTTPISPTLPNPHEAVVWNSEHLFLTQLRSWYSLRSSWRSMHHVPRRPPQHPVA